MEQNKTPISLEIRVQQLKTAKLLQQNKWTFNQRDAERATEERAKRRARRRHPDPCYPLSGASFRKDFHDQAKGVDRKKTPLTMLELNELGIKGSLKVECFGANDGELSCCQKVERG